MGTRETERILKALANRRRLAILLYLKKEKEATVGVVAEEIDLSFKATSRHLLILSHVDIIEKEQRGLEVYCRIHAQFRTRLKQILTIL